MKLKSELIVLKKAPEYVHLFREMVVNKLESLSFQISHRRVTRSAAKLQ